MDKALKHKAQFLLDILHILQISKPCNDSDFRLVIKWFTEEGIITIRELADALLVSMPTIRRWASGRNLPSNLLRQPIFELLREVTTKKIEKHSRQS